MKVCSTSCFIAIVFLVGMIYMTFSVNKCEIAQSFMDTLSDEQLQHYHQIVSERQGIYIRGFLLGLLLSAAFMFWTTQLEGAEKLKKMNVMCVVAAITFLTSYFYYILSKKPKMMVIYLEKQKQREMWAKVYRKMQFHYHFGLLLGIIGAVILSNAFCKGGEE